MISDRDLLIAAGEMGVELTEVQVDQLGLYERQIQEWSQRVNLVSKGDRSRLKSRHFLDSLSGLPYLPRTEHSLLDLGSGGGLPGIPMKIARPGTRVTLLESGRMKSLFLQHVTKVLGLDELRVWKARAEDISKEEDFVGYDVVVCRAVGALPLLWKLSRPLLNPTGYMLAFKGPGAEKEWELGGPENIVVKYHKASVPFIERERLFVEVRTKS